MWANKPMPLFTGTSGPIPLSSPRKWIGDLLHFARAVPSLPVQRAMELAPLIAVRERCLRTPSWPAIFLKAYSLVCRELPELRRSYLPRPYARLWQHADSTASVAVMRRYRNEDAVFFIKIPNPETHSTWELDDLIRRHREAPIESIGSFRRLIRITRCPRLLRRMIWSLGLNWNGRLRCKFFGTFGLSVYSSTGSDSLHPISPLTTLLNYGPIGATGSVTVRIVYDHRVMDGPVVAAALRRLEECLKTNVLEELRGDTDGGPRLRAA
jgi:hypothetical protein